MGYLGAKMPCENGFEVLEKSVFKVTQISAD